MPQITEPLYHLGRRDMAVGLHKGLHDRKPIFKVHDSILIEQLAELFLFLLVQCLWYV